LFGLPNNGLDQSDLPHQKEKMTSRHFCVSLLVSQTLWVWPIVVYVHTHNIWIFMAAMGVEIIFGAILLVLWVWASAAISDLKKKRILCGKPKLIHYR